MASLETENKTLKSKNTRLKQQLADAKKRVEDLEKVLKESQTNNYKREDDNESEEEEDTLELSAIWDDHDCIYRCSECSWEVVHGICQSCGEEFDYTSDDEERENNHGLSHSVETEALSLDRVLSQRGTTPLLDVDPSRRKPSSLDGHISDWMYFELLQRGATRLMCETFFLEYSNEKGIVAWADTELYEGFTLPSDPTNDTSTATEERAIKKGDYWKIYLGRRIVLEEDDYDGSQFIEGIIEDGVLFTLLLEIRAQNELQKIPGIEQEEEEEEEEEDEEEEDEEEEEDVNKIIVWKTFLESPGIWATQPAFQYRDESTGPIVDVGYLTDHDHDESDQEDASMDLDADKPENAEDNDSKMADVDIDVDEEEEDSGWATKANVPDRPWNVSPEPSPAPDDTMDQMGTGIAAGSVEADQEMAPAEYDDDDSFDSDFDSEDSC